jgi:Phage capsid protein
MANTVDKAYVKTYESNVRHLAQQGINRLRPFVMEKSVNSVAHHWDRIGAATAVQKTARKVATPDNETVWSRRVSVPVVYHVGDTVEQEDPSQMLADPKSTYAKAHGMAMKRAQDDEIIRAATGTALDGDGVANAFPAGQLIGDGTGALTFNMITDVFELFTAADIDPDERKVFVIGPKQAKALVRMTEATSGDYNTIKPLATKGYVEGFMGFDWVVSTRLLQPTGTSLSCFAMTTTAIGLQINRDIWSRCEEDPSISFTWRLYSAAQYGAIRVEDKHLVHVKVLNT